MKKVHAQRFNFVFLAVIRFLVFLFSYLIIYAASGNKPVGAICGGLVTLAVHLLFLRRKTLFCDICKSHIEDEGYSGEIGGRKFKSICTPCMDGISAKLRSDFNLENA